MSYDHPELLQGGIAPGHAFFELIEEAYRVFAYPKPASIGVCIGCCMNPKIEADFFNPPIRALPLNYVQDWYSAAYEQHGTPKETWAYLIPRILEFMAAEEDICVSAFEVSLNRFENGNPKNWSADEWRVLDSFQRKYLQRAAETGPELLDDVICLFELGGWPLTDLLDQVSAMSDAVLAQCFWRDWCSGCAPGREGVRTSTFWTRYVDSVAAHNFYTSQDMYDRMKALALADDTDPELAEKALVVAGIIETCAP